ncbi:DNA segregation ATPase FtsK/SpoIIIE, S-DNA-T family [Cohaesibacter sp. ES.047]|uniref:DNA translocase FtsK n=1 Tax=Cohaesibacter sp. ES.047 TaxID=1798205 RepID=UPI000BB76C45|nr:DNA translocase FtsK [Cohaesibacter sp. ES.047]SNY90636.1 DNA segregation ATPase FtsK/SpoIIIE, S-DNA-T family [Cohaesibacter sp. ES.047]
MTAYDDYGAAPRARHASRRQAKDSALRQALRRNVFAATGLFGLLVCAAVAASLVTWHVGDPSLSNAVDHAPRNILGRPGAILSDLLIQGFGLATAFLLIPPVVWLWRLVRLLPTGITRNRAMAWFGGLGLIAIAFAAVPAPNSWPLPLSLGGMIGDSFLSIVARFNPTFMKGLGAIGVAAVAAIAGLAMLLNASNASLSSLMLKRKRAEVQIHDDADTETADEDWDEEDYEDQQDFDSGADPEGALDRTKGPNTRRSSILSIPLGALGHWLLSRKANKLRRRKPAVADEALNHAPPPIQPKPRKKGLLTSLLGEDDDGLDELANRLEPRLDVASAPSYQQGTGLHNPSSSELGYAGPDDFAPHHPQNAGDDYDTAPVWEVEDDYADAPLLAHGQSKGQPRGQAVGMAPREIDRATQDPQHRAMTNEGAETKPVAAGKNSKRMVRSGQGNVFTRKDPYQLPTLEFLAQPETLGPNAGLTPDQLEHNARLLEGVLSDFGIRGEIIKVRPGPVVTLYELEPAPGIKSSRVIGLADDIARSMSAISARVAVVPGRNAIGIELPNARRETVFLREILASKDFDKSKAKLPICLGKNISGDPVVVDLARMPHVLVAGTTGSGKSVSINTTIMSLLYRHKPDECRLIMIDPKMLELSIYDGIPHLLTPVVTDPAKAVVALKWAVREMEQRYKNMSKMGVRNIDGFNKRVRDSLAKGEHVTRTIQTGFDPETGDPIYEQEELHLEPMPYIVVVVDEMADLMMVAGKDIEGAIQRLAQMARAAGIHLIMATQRPSVDVITGTIKANFPTRMSFQVTSKIDSRTILGEMGAEQLLGMGDMLYMAGGGRIQRVHGAFISDEEVEEIVNHLKRQGTPDYLEAVTEETDDDPVAGASSGGGGGGSDAETLYDKAVDIVIRDRKASTSYIQRRLSIGYNRAATLIEQMENEGVISAANHAGKREVLVPEEGATM